MLLKGRKIKYLVGDTKILENMNEVPALAPFSETVIELLDTVSHLLLKSTRAREYSDVITFAFWCRKASVLQIKENYNNLNGRLGRGIAFHIAPSNVAINFAYSLAAGLLAGNSNIVKVSTKEYLQVNIICDAFNQAIDKNVKAYICLLQYDHDKDINDILSAYCNIRVIWGGNDTIATIRKSPLKPRATELTFADRFSLCIVEADCYLKEANKEKLAMDFYNDTFLTDQNACSSPRILIWLGKNIEEAQEIFWKFEMDIVKERYHYEPIQVVNKFTGLCRQAVDTEDCHLHWEKDNSIFRVEINKIREDIMAYRGNSGYFMEYKAKTIQEILPLCTEECQTIAYYGMDKSSVIKLLIQNGPGGIDRIVPIGKTMDFSLRWDGYDLIYSMSRVINSV